MSRFQRRSDDPERQRTTTLELFYDLVFVFAVTQVSHLLLRNLDWTGVGQMALALCVVWWAWNYTTWLTNELDPESLVVRGVIVTLTLASLLMAVAIPEAFGSRSLLFAGSYVFIQVGRHAFLAFVSAPAGTPERSRALHILIWFIGAGVFWIAGALFDGTTRTVLWLIALAVDYSAPILTYPVPWLKKVTTHAWEVSTAHFAERFQLFVIIALGETIVLTGETTSELELDWQRALAFVIAFLVTAAMWWLYFDYVARIAERRLETASDRVVIARDGFTYLHVVLIAGVIVSAVGDELIIAHPAETLSGTEAAIVVAGPATYLLGHVLFRLRLAGSLSYKRLLGAAGCVVAGFLGVHVSALVVGLIVLLVVVGVIVWEQIAGRRRDRRGERAGRLDHAAVDAAGDAAEEEGRVAGARVEQLGLSVIQRDGARALARLAELHAVALAQQRVERAAVQRRALQQREVVARQMDPLDGDRDAVGGADAVDPHDRDPRRPLQRGGDLGVGRHDLLRERPPAGRHPARDDVLAERRERFALHDRPSRDERPLTLDAVGKAVGGEPVELAPHRHPRDAEALGEHPLRRQQRARPQPLHQLLERVAQLRAFRRRPVKRGERADVGGARPARGRIGDRSLVHA
jgi:low temperature requirement protein LtrA